MAFAAAAQAAETTNFTYDTLGRLVATSSSGSVNNGQTTQLGYDPAGNRATYVVTPGGTAAAVADASFEAPALAAGAYQYNPTASGATFLNGAGIASNGSPWNFAAAPDGSQVAFLQAGPNPAQIAMAVTGLTVGAHYAVSFWIAARPGYGTVPVTVAIDGTALGTFTPGSTAFAQVTSATFTAAATTGTLTFTGITSATDMASAIDAVSLVTVP